MANCVIIMGASGTGKTTSLRTLDPKTTVVINVLGKKLSFKGSAKNYGSDQERQNLFQLHDHNQIMQCLKYIGENKADVKNVVIDDSMYIMRKEYFTRSKENGYGKIAINFQ